MSGYQIVKSIMLAFILVNVFIYFLVYINMNTPEETDVEIMRSAEASCLYDQKQKIFKEAFDKCVATTSDTSTKCLKSSYSIAGLDYDIITENLPVTYIAKANADKINGNLPLSDGKKYIPSCAGEFK